MDSGDLRFIRSIGRRKIMQKHKIIAFINLFIGSIGIIFILLPIPILKVRYELGHVDLNEVLITWGLIFLWISFSFFVKRLLILLLSPILGLLTAFLLFWSMHPFYLFIFVYIFGGLQTIFGFVDKFFGTRPAYSGINLPIFVLFFFPLFLLIADIILAI